MLTLKPIGKCSIDAFSDSHDRDQFTRAKMWLRYRYIISNGYKSDFSGCEEVSGKLEYPAGSIYRYTVNSGYESDYTVHVVDV